MLVNRTEYAPGLGDLASTLKARSKANKPTNAPGIAQTLAPGFSGSLKVAAAQNKVLSLIGQGNALAQYNKDVAAGNINPAFYPPPAAVTPAQLAAAQQAYGQATAKSGTIAQKSLIKLNAPVQAAMQSSAPVVSPTAGAMPKLASSIAKLFAPSSTQTATLSPGNVSAAASPLQQTAAALVAAQPAAIAPSSDAGGGGGGGGGGDDSSTTDTTDATLPPTGWAALSPSMQTGIIVGGLVVVGGIVYLIRRKH